MSYLYHRQSKKWTGNAGQSANVTDATFVIQPDTLYFGTIKPKLNIFQDLIFTYFKQWQYPSNNRLLRLFFGTTKRNPTLNVCVVFDYTNVAVACWLRSFTKTFNGNLRLCLYTSLKKYANSIVARNLV